MNDLPGIRASPQARGYLNDIAAAMVLEFSIPLEEAVGRIGEFWTGQAFLSPEALITLFHQPADHWAKQIYYGRKRWWADEETLRPAPYPRQVTPKQDGT